MCDEIIILFVELGLCITEATPMPKPENLNPDKFSSIQPSVPKYVKV